MSHYSPKNHDILDIVTIGPFKVIGISVKTINTNGKSAEDIGQLWHKFMSEGIAEKIPAKVDPSIYSIYTNYQGDHAQPYDTILGCKVESLEHIPAGMVGQSFEGGTYAKYVSRGDLSKGVVYATWEEINELELDRAFEADFEIYGNKALNPASAEVDVFVGIKK